MKRLPLPLPAALVLLSVNLGAGAGPFRRKGLGLGDSRSEEAPPQRHVTTASADPARQEGESPGRGLPGAMVRDEG